MQARDVGNFNTPDGQWNPYMVLEWLDGKPLDVVLWEERRGGLSHRSLTETLSLLDPCAAALDIAHQRGIAHRDVKPANFFVLGDPRGVDVHLKVLDFGIAKVMAEHAGSVAELAHTGKYITSITPNYGAPYQFSRSHGATGQWTDVFAMALIVVEVLRGGLAALDGNDFMQMAVASRDPQTRPTPRAFGLEVSEAVEQVFRKALAVSPAERYPNMGEFWSALMHAVFPDAPTWQSATSPGGGPGFTTSMPRVAVHPPRRSVNVSLSDHRRRSAVRPDGARPLSHGRLHPRPRSAVAPRPGAGARRRSARRGDRDRRHARARRRRVRRLPHVRRSCRVRPRKPAARRSQRQRRRARPSQP